MEETEKVIPVVEEKKEDINIVQKLDSIMNKLKESEVEVVDDEFTQLEFNGTRLYGTGEQIQKLFADYSKYFGEVVNPKNTKTNPHFHFNYAPLDVVMESIRPIMSKHGLALIQITTNNIKDGLVSVNNILTHKDGAYMTIEGLVIRPAKPDAQGIGGAITYGRRYTASSLSGIMSEEDDDGESAAEINPDTKVKLSGVTTPAKNTSTDKGKTTTKVETLDKLKTKANALAKAKMAEVGNKPVLKSIEDTLSKKISETVEDDKENLNKLITNLNGLKKE